MKKTIAALVLLLLLAAAAVFAWRWYGGVSNREVRATVVREAETTRELINVRCDRLEARADRTDADLERIERKLDRLLELATPQLTDGMRLAK